MATNEQSETKEDSKVYCCAAKKYFCQSNNLVNTLEIVPRLLICKKTLKISEMYEQTVVIKNKGLHPRLLKCYGDSEDMSVRVFGMPHSNYLQPAATAHIIVRIAPRTRKHINRRRQVLIEFTHPNIIFEVPILVIQNRDEPYLPTELVFPRSIPHTNAYYEFTIYNPTLAPAFVTLRALGSCLTSTVEPPKIPSRDYARILLKLHVRDLEVISSGIKLRCINSLVTINYKHQPIPATLYPNVAYINFEETKFERVLRKEFTICNESSEKVSFNLTFATGDEHLTFMSGENQSRESLEEVELRPDSSYESEPSRRSFQKTRFDTGDGGESKEEHSCDISLPQSNEQKIDSNAYKNYKLDPMRGELLPNSSITIAAKFHPVMIAEDIPEKAVPPFSAVAKILINSPQEFLDTKHVTFDGLIDGPDVYLSPKCIDFRQVYLGEEHCEQIHATNIDGIVSCEISFLDSSDPDAFNCIIAPEKGLSLDPCQTGTFYFTFFTLKIGKMNFKLRFKTKCGAILNVMVKATSMPVRVKTFPDLVEFGSIPFAVPQKRSVLLMNPLSVPVSLQCSVIDNGVETPLVLNVDDIDGLPPVDIRNPIEAIQSMANEDAISAYHASDIDDMLSNIVSSALTIRSEDDDDKLTICSEGFQNDVIESIGDIANKILNNIKAKRISEKNEAEVKIIQEAANELLALPYFSDMTKYNNYACMDWESIPSDPKELYHDTEIIHLKPNAGRSLTVLVIPNNIGYFNRTISIRCCPHTPLHCEDEQMMEIIDNQMIVKSKLMTTNLWVEYNCRAPDIKWNPEIVFPGVIYATQNYEFDIEFENESNIGGFLHFSIVPRCPEGVMRFRENKWKFYMTPECSMKVPCAVEFRRTGNITLTGLVKIVGKTLGYPFHISAYVLPPKIDVFPEQIYKRQNVLECTYIYIYITNLTPTTTALNIYLRSENYQRVDPHGAQLNPDGQGMYISIRSMFSDPDVYKNVLYIDLMCGKIKEIPITINIVGMPVFFDPDIKQDYDMGVILISSENNYESRTTNFSKTIRVWNMGQRPYSVTFYKLKSTTNKKHQSKCFADALKVQFYLLPKMIVLQPGAEDFFQITAVACEEVEVYTEFRVLIVDQTDTKRFTSMRFTLKAKFAQAELSWSRKEIIMDYNSTHIFKEHPQLELVKLINGTGTTINDVYLKVNGPFKIKELFEQKYTKDLKTDVLPHEKKELTIWLNKKELCDRIETSLNGRIVCLANNKTQKTLALKVNINYPDIVIVESEIVLFIGYKEDSTSIVLENIGFVDAQYKWKKLQEYIQYVAENDYVWAFAHDLLYDLLRMLDLHEADEASSDPLCSENMTLCYQKYRCKLKALEDHDRIVDIIYEIIDKLDLEHKRYKLELSDSYEDLSLDTDKPDTERSSQRNVKRTLDKIIDGLKLEDSYNVSEASEEECEKDRKIYFYEKSGTVLKQQGAHCLLHLPGVQKGYALKASFLLDVVGGQPQTLNITLVNLEKAIELSSNSVYLGVKPWYELFDARLRVKNVTQYLINIQLTEYPSIKRNRRRHAHLIDGYVCILSSRVFLIPGYDSARIRADGVMGFCDEFIRDFKLTINDHDSVLFRLRGQGVMPMLLATHKDLQRPEQTQEEIIEEYKLLQRIYYFTMFKDITYVEEDVEDIREEGEEGGNHDTLMQRDFSDLSLLESVDSEHSSAAERLENNWALLLRTYVIVYDNASLPHAMILEQLINMYKFKERLIHNPITRDILQMVYRDYEKQQCIDQEKKLMILKYFTVQPLPYEQLGYFMPMPNLKINQFRRYSIDLQFIGPGKLIAAARTAVKMPGLFVYFEIIENYNNCPNFMFYRAEEKMPDFYVKKYRNIWERLIDAETDPKLQHAHSFDCELRCKFHKRTIATITAQDRKDIHNYYNSLNKSVYHENKHHFINSIIYSKSQQNFSGTQIRVHVLIKPSEQYYEKKQVIEDYLYIDLHMGPTLPILMRGLIT